MIELGLVTLYLCEIAVVEIPGILELIVLEDDDPASLVAHCQILPCFVVRNCSQDIILRNILLVSLPQTIDVHPVQTIGHSVRIDLWLATLRLPKVLGGQWRGRF